MNGHTDPRPQVKMRHQQLGDTEARLAHVHPADAERHQDLQQTSDQLRLVGVGAPVSGSTPYGAAGLNP